MSKCIYTKMQDKSFKNEFVVIDNSNFVLRMQVLQ